MKSNSLNPVYKTYIKLCKETNAVPIKKKEFEIVHNTVRKNITNMVKHGIKYPYCAIDIDGKFVYFAEIYKDGKSVFVNIWSHERELKYFLDEGKL